MSLKTITSKPVFYISLIILQGLIFGIGNPIVKFAYESITPLWCLAIRFLLAAGVFLLFFGKGACKELRQAKPMAWLPTSLCVALAYITCNVALNLTEATSVGFLMSLAVVFTPPLARIITGRSIRRSYFPVLLTAVAGLYLLSFNGGSFHFGPGEFLALICSFGMAGSLVFGENSLDTLSPAAVSLAQLSVTAAASLLCAIFIEPLPDLGAVEPVAWWVMAYLVLLCSCACYIFQNIALLHLPASVVSLTQCSEPLFTAAASFLILGERLTPMGLCGVTLLMITIVYGNYFENRIIVKENLS